MKIVLALVVVSYLAFVTNVVDGGSLRVQDVDDRVSLERPKRFDDESQTNDELGATAKQADSTDSSIPNETDDKINEVEDETRRDKGSKGSKGGKHQHEKQKEHEKHRFNTTTTTPKPATAASTVKPLNTTPKPPSITAPPKPSRPLSDNIPVPPSPPSHPPQPHMHLQPNSYHIFEPNVAPASHHSEFPGENEAQIPSVYRQEHHNSHQQQQQHQEHHHHHHHPMARQEFEETLDDFDNMQLGASYLGPPPTAYAPQPSNAPYAPPSYPKVQCGHNLLISCQPSVNSSPCQSQANSYAAPPPPSYAPKPTYRFADEEQNLERDDTLAEQPQQGFENEEDAMVGRSLALAPPAADVKEGEYFHPKPHHSHHHHSQQHNDQEHHSHPSHHHHHHHHDQKVDVTPHSEHVSPHSGPVSPKPEPKPIVHGEHLKKVDQIHPEHPGKTEKLRYNYSPLDEDEALVGQQMPPFPQVPDTFQGPEQQLGPDARQMQFLPQHMMQPSIPQMRQMRPDFPPQMQTEFPQQTNPMMQPLIPIETHQMSPELHHEFQQPMPPRSNQASIQPDFSEKPQQQPMPPRDEFQQPMPPRNEFQQPMPPRRNQPDFPEQQFDFQQQSMMRPSARRMRQMQPSQFSRYTRQMQRNENQQQPRPMPRSDLQVQPEQNQQMTRPDSQVQPQQDQRQMPRPDFQVQTQQDQRQMPRPDFQVQTQQDQRQMQRPDFQMQPQQDQRQMTRPDLQVQPQQDQRQVQRQDLQVQPQQDQRQMQRPDFQMQPQQDPQMPRPDFLPQQSPEFFQQEPRRLDILPTTTQISQPPQHLIVPLNPNFDPSLHPIPQQQMPSRPLIFSPAPPPQFHLMPPRAFMRQMEEQLRRLRFDEEPLEESLGEPNPMMMNDEMQFSFGVNPMMAREYY
ncbi:extensin-like [Contarinia nasturtii]|uniref:extensin-like n=1 Tax=Contarinia nasturtii TaxID=265458 RepID=UPI0012D4A0BE|nr:extensin-like [Contarinia nasturtii]